MSGLRDRNPKNPIARLRGLGRRVRQEYSDGHDQSLLGHSVVLAGYTAFIGLLAGAGRVSGARLPERFTVQDTVLLCAATHKASRIVTKESVASPLRAPFTRFEEATGEAEVKESPKDGGARHTVGELLTCPFCFGVWVATGLTAGLVLAPRATRLVTTALTAVAASDAAQLAYDAAKQRVSPRRPESGSVATNGHRDGMSAAVRH